MKAIARFLKKIFTGELGFEGNYIRLNDSLSRHKLRNLCIHTGGASCSQ